MIQVTDIETMRASDVAAIDAGTPAEELMRRAGKALFDVCTKGARIAVVCGIGNNAGDGYALAEQLHAQGTPCTVFCLSDRVSETAKPFYDACIAGGVPFAGFTGDTDLSVFDEIVDCIFGTGFRGAPEGIFADAIRRINESGARVISADINSGLNGDNGTAELCVRSDLTVAIGSLKTGLLLNSAKDVIRKLECADIGIPLIGKSAFLVEAEDFRDCFRTRAQDSHKGSYGYVAILGGCAEYSGAVKLANLSCSALRSGCGVVKLIVPRSVGGSVAPYLLESTLDFLPDRDGHALFLPEELDRVLQKQSALAIGMGWGSAPENARILAYILQNYRIPVIIDADGLNTLAGMDPEILSASECKILLTPHLKEFERLSGIPMETVRQDPVRIAERYAREHRVTLILKGACTVITDGEETYLCNRGCAGMATAGSGDVLSGILVGLAGSHPPTPLTAACGVFLNGLAGELAARRMGEVSMLASDTVSMIPEAVGILSGKVKMC